MADPNNTSRPALDASDLAFLAFVARVEFASDFARVVEAVAAAPVALPAYDEDARARQFRAEIYRSGLRPSTRNTSNESDRRRALWQ